MAYLADLVLLKAYEGIKAEDNSQDDLLQHFVDTAQASIDRFCRQTFEAEEDVTRYFDAAEDVDDGLLMLDAPLCAITSVTNGDGNPVSASKYVTEPRNAAPWWGLRLKANAGIVWTYSGAPENAIAVTGKWAYSESAPADIVQVTLRMASYLYRQRNNATDLDRAVQLSGGVILPADLPRDIQTFLVRGGYRRLV